MPASKYDFSIEQGTSFKLALIYKDPNNNPFTAGTSIDMSHYADFFYSKYGP